MSADMRIPFPETAYAFLRRLDAETSVIVALVVCALVAEHFGSSSVWAIAFIASLAILSMHASGASKRPAPRLLWSLLLGFVALTGISFGESAVRHAGFSRTVLTAAYALLFLWSLNAASSANRDGYLRKLVRVFAILLIAGCAVGAVRYALGSPYPFSGILQQHDADVWNGFLIAGWPVVVHWLFRHRGMQRNPLMRTVDIFLRTIIAGFVVACVALSADAAALIVITLQIIAWCVIIVRRSSDRLSLARVLPIWLSIGVIASITAQGLSFTRARFLADAPQIPVSVSGEERFLIFDRSIRAMELSLMRPATGFGPGTFSYELWRVDGNPRGTFGVSPGALFTVAAERGIPAAILFLMLLGVIVFRAYAPLRPGEGHSPIPQLSFRVLSLLSIGGIIVHNLVAFSLDSVAVSLPFWMILGALLALPSVRPALSISGNIRRAVESACAIGMLFLLSVYGISSLEMAVAARNEGKGNLAGAATWYEWAAAGWFRQDALLHAAEAYRALGDNEKAKQSAERYVLTNDDDWQGWALLASIARDLQDPALELRSASNAYDRGRIVNLGVILSLLKIQHLRDNVAAIESLKPETDALLAGFAVLIERNESGIALTRNVEDFVAICNLLAELFPDAAPRYTVLAARADHHAEIHRKSAD